MRWAASGRTRSPNCMKISHSARASPIRRPGTSGEKYTRRSVEVCVPVVHGKPEAEVLRIRAHLGTSLDAAMPSDRHETALGPSDNPACEAEVHDRLHVVHAEPMVCDAHAPHEHGRSRPAVHFGE